MIRIFMSYGMNGRTEEEQRESRMRLIKRAKLYFKDDTLDKYTEAWKLRHDGELSQDEIDNTESYIRFEDNHKCAGSDKDGRLYYLGEAIKKMDKCDAIIFDYDWKEHKGCQIERQVAATYGLKIIE